MSVKINKEYVLNEKIYVNMYLTLTDIEERKYLSQILDEVRKHSMVCDCYYNDFGNFATSYSLVILANSGFYTSTYFERLLFKLKLKFPQLDTHLNETMSFTVS